jgi:hypothetical protein
MKPAHEMGNDKENKDLVGEGSDSLKHAPHRKTVTGAQESADKTSPYIQSIADFATKAISHRTNGVLNLIRIIRADTQLVAGKKVTLDLEVGKPI